jgi:hypothetical protein
MNARELHIQSILNGPQYFFCKRHLCTMPKRSCALRQISDAGLAVYLDCKGCDQGAEIKKEFPGLTAEKKRPLFCETRRKSERVPYDVWVARQKQITGKRDHDTPGQNDTPECQPTGMGG